MGFHLPKKPDTTIEVTYFTIPPEIQNVEISDQRKSRAKSRGEKKEKIAQSKKPVPKKEDPTIKKEKPIEKPPAPKEKPEEKAVIEEITPIPTKRSIRLETTPELEGDVSYMSYSQLIRERIQYHLYRNYREGMGEGEVTINFILKSNGRLKYIAIIDKQSSPNIKLRRAAMKSIQQSSPFKPFPKELTVPEISFKVTISFKKDLN